MSEEELSNIILEDGDEEYEPPEEGKLKSITDINIAF